MALSADRLIQDNRQYLADLHAVLTAIDPSGIADAALRFERAFEAGRQIFVAGNGGSAGTASHLACDFQKTTLAKSHATVTKRIRAIALSDNVPLLTAWGNDVSYDEVFGQQLLALANPGDVLLVITASGNSPNILNALHAARELGVETIGFLGFQGGKAKALCDLAVVAESENYGVIEDAHSVLMHMITANLKGAVLGPG